MKPALARLQQSLAESPQTEHTESAAIIVRKTFLWGDLSQARVCLDAMGELDITGTLSEKDEGSMH